MGAANPTLILDALRSGSRTMRELASICGFEPEDKAGLACVRQTIKRLRDSGEPIHNARYAGSRGGAIYTYGGRRCGHPGCITILSAADNRGLYCRRHVAVHVDYLDLLIAALTMDVGGEAKTELPGQMSLLCEGVAS